MESNCRIDTLGSEHLCDLGKHQSLLFHISVSSAVFRIGQYFEIYQRQKKYVSLSVPPTSPSIFSLSLMHSCHQGVGWRSAS